MGNETFYCIQCGIRVSGGDPTGDRSHCPACLGLPVEPTPRPARDSSKRIRKPSSPAMTAVAARPRTTDIIRPRTSRTLIVGVLLFVGAALFALTSITFSPEGDAHPAAAVVIPPPSPPAPAPPAAPPPAPEPQELREKVQRPAAPAPVDPAVEARADQLSGEIEEAASALADEGRFDDALARIRAFPAEYRRTRAWSSLEALKRQIEARVRAR